MTNSTPAHQAGASKRALFSPEHRALIHAVKTELKSKAARDKTVLDTHEAACACALHVFYNLVRGLDPQRGFRPAKRLGADANGTFIRASEKVRKMLSWPKASVFATSLTKMAHDMPLDQRRAWLSAL